MANQDNEHDSEPNDVLDEGDQAAAFQMRENNLALAKVKAQLGPESHPDFDGESCVECGNEIPEGRLALGKVRCVHCQSKLENRGKYYAS